MDLVLAIVAAVRHFDLRFVVHAGGVLEPPEPSPEADMARLFAKYDGHHMPVLMEDPQVAAALLARLADAAPDDDHIEALSISMVEAFLSRGTEVFPAFEAAMRTSSNLRKAWSVAWSAVPDEWEARFNALVQPDENLMELKRDD